MDVDVLIIGSGAGGGTLARALADSGLTILILERGNHLPREWDNWNPEAVFHAHRYHTDERWQDGEGRSFAPVTGYHVGGNTKFYGAAVLRRRIEDFIPRHHRGGDTPAWPIGYADLAPFYAEAEAWYYAHGEAGADPTEGPREAYPYPPMPHEPRLAEVAEKLRGLGLRPFPLPLALHHGETADSPCVRCPTCDGFPCMVHAKGDAELCGVRPVLAHSNVRLESGVRVLRLETTADGRRISRAVTTKGSYAARIVVLCAGAINSAALLLASANTRHPHGLANGSDQVGRNYMCHVNSACMAIDPGRENPTIFQKTLAVNDFYNESGDPTYPYPLGHIQGLGKVTPDVLHAQRPQWPAPLCTWVARHSVDWWLTTEDLPSPDNRVTVAADGTIRLRWQANNGESHERLCRRWRETLHRIGYPMVFFQRMGIEAVAHQVGTARFGEDPATSVLDAFCKAHELDNLYVADASFMPSIAAVNPSLTIMANAIRIAHHLRDRLGAGAA